jgi:phage anti-repressor protein
MINKEDISFIELLKKHTIVDTEFINTFFSKFKIGEELNFDIKDVSIAKYLGITLKNLRQRLSNEYTKNNNFIENVDFIKVKTGKTSGVSYMCNYSCFEKIAMAGDSEESEAVRIYFVKIREFLVENQKTILQAMENRTKLNKYTGFEGIYFFVIDKERPDIFKIGRTTNIVRRLRNYNVGRINEVDLKYYALVKNNVLIEKCMKHNLIENRYIKNREIYKVNPSTLKKIIDDCYCKYVNNDDNKKLYDDIGHLLGLYSFIKDKPKLEPYVIIDNDIFLLNKKLSKKQTKNKKRTINKTILKNM